MKVMYLSIYLCCEFIALTKNEQITQILRLISCPSLVRQARCILFPTTLECWSFCLVPMLVKFAWEQSTHAVCGKQNLEEIRKALQKFETFASDFLLKRCHGFRATKTSRDIAMWHHKADLVTSRALKLRVQPRSQGPFATSGTTSFPGCRWSRVC